MSEKESSIIIFPTRTPSSVGGNETAVNLPLPILDVRHYKKEKKRMLKMEFYIIITILLLTICSANTNSESVQEIELLAIPLSVTFMYYLVNLVNIQNTLLLKNQPLSPQFKNRPE